MLQLYFLFNNCKLILKRVEVMLRKSFAICIVNDGNGSGMNN